MSKYVGLRYVPKIIGDWDNTKNTAYESLSVVMYGGNSYISKQNVPLGIEISDTTFWIKCADYNAQLDLYRQDLVNYNNNLSGINTSISGINSNINGINNTITDIQEDIVNINDDLAKINNVIVNVKDFGAVGDGVADDTVAIQNALNKKGSIIFDDGVYKVTDTLYIDSNTKISGSNATISINHSNSVFKNKNYLTPVVTDPLTPIGSLAETVISDKNIVIEDLIFEGNNYKTAKTITLIGCKNARFRNLQFLNGGSALDLRGVQNIITENCYSYNMSDDVYSNSDQGLQSISSNVYYINCYAEACCSNNIGGSTRNVFEVDDGMENIFYINCVAKNCYGIGFTCHIHDGGRHLINLNYINCVSDNCNALTGYEGTVQVGGFATGQCPDTSVIKNVNLINCKSINNKTFAYACRPGAELGIRENINIVGGYYQCSGNTNIDSMNCGLYIGKYFKNVNVADLVIDVASAYYGIYTYADYASGNLQVSNCEIKAGYPLNLKNTNGMTRLDNLNIAVLINASAPHERIIDINSDMAMLSNITLFGNGTSGNFINNNFIGFTDVTRIFITNCLFKNTASVTTGSECIKVSGSGNMFMSNSLIESFESGVEFINTNTRAVINGNTINVTGNKIINVPTLNIVNNL